MKYKIMQSKRAREIVESLSVRQLINQLVCPDFRAETADITEEYGSVFFHQGKKEQLEQKIAEFKRRCAIPPLIAGDLESGPGMIIYGATEFPSFMGCSQTNSVELAYEMGKIAAQEGMEAGYNWTFAPVADLHHLYDSPIVSIRSAGKAPEQVIKICDAYIRGVQEHGMIATIKHFPGDGFCIYDQHLTTPDNPLSMGEWWKLSGRVFKELVDQGVMSVMPGHISLPAYDDINEELGIYPPATLSKKLMVDLLRGELGFEGLIVSDAVNMGGFANFMNYYEACATFWENGGDVLLFPKMGRLHEEMEKLIAQGKLHIETLKERACRVISLKEQMGLLDPVTEKSATAIDYEKNMAVSNQVVDECVTLIRDRKKLIPFAIKKDTRVLHLVILNMNSEHKDLMEAFEKELKKYSDCVTQLVDPGPDNVFKDLYERKYDLVVCSVGNLPRFGTNVARLNGITARNMMKGWAKLGTPVIFVSHFHPFIHKEYVAMTDTIINTYGNTAYTAQRVMEGITGRNPFKTEIHVHD